MLKCSVVNVNRAHSDLCCSASEVLFSLVSVSCLVCLFVCLLACQEDYAKKLLNGFPLVEGWGSAEEDPIQMCFHGQEKKPAASTNVSLS